jgi:polysaccharide biosynthesis/export protein
MNLMRKLQVSSLLGLFSLIFLCTSCVNTKQAVYFNNIADTTLQLKLMDVEPLIQKGDIISITVSDLNPEAAASLNAPNLANVASGAGSPGYLVNQEGFLQFPRLGNIRAAGMTKSQLKDLITKQLLQRGLGKEPIVTVRHLNFKVTVLGEVSRPTVVSVPSEQITLLEALGLAGDLTIFGRRDNVLLIRDEEGKRTIRRINLNESSTLNSPYYYLKPNDVIYVEPNEAKVASSTRGVQLLPTIFGAISVAVIIIDRLLK